MKLIRHMTVLISALFVQATAPALPFAANVGHWTYDGTEGPGNWGGISKDYASCRSGRHQSPIDINATTKEKLPEIQFRYKPSPLKLINNGHTAQVNYANGSQIKVGKDRYELVQFHFHAPSEERVRGKSFDMVAHLVHKNDAGQLAVVSVLFDQGRENVMLQPVWMNLQDHAGPEQSLPELKIDAAQMLPQARGYYTFEGSLTTPPCSEGVRWFVLKQPVELSKSQVAQFTRIFHSNARPVQPLNDRIVKESQ